MARSHAHVTSSCIIELLVILQNNEYLEPTGNHMHVTRGVGDAASHQ
jgi:hypothetical protein